MHASTRTHIKDYLYLVPVARNFTDANDEFKNTFDQPIFLSILTTSCLLYTHCYDFIINIRLLNCWWTAIVLINCDCRTPTGYCLNLPSKNTANRKFSYMSINRYFGLNIVLILDMSHPMNGTQVAVTKLEEHIDVHTCTYIFH